MQLFSCIKLLFYFFYANIFNMEENLGNIIKSRRQEKRLSVRELAKLAKINHTDVSKIEKNKILKPSIKMLLSLSEILQINLMAIYLEGYQNYLYYKPIIEQCTQLSNDQIQEVISFINKIKTSEKL